MSCGVGHRCGSDLALLWLLSRPATTASIKPLAWEPPYAAEGPEKGEKDKKKKEKKRTKEKHRINMKTRFKMAIYIFINNYLKCKWTECSNQKT